MKVKMIMNNGKLSRRLFLILISVSFFLVIQLSSFSAHAEESLFECHGHDDYGSFHMSLKEKGTVQLEATRNKKKFHCTLSLVGFDFSVEAIVQRFMFQADLGFCETELLLPLSDPSLLKQMNVVVTLESKNKEASLQWITYLAPSSCLVTQMDFKKLERFQKQWREERAQ